MTTAREATSKVKFVDDYCKNYREVFGREIRSWECFRDIELGLISEIKRKSLPNIARAVGLGDGQELHHFIANSPWKVEELRKKRLELIKQAIGKREIYVCIDETGDKKKG